MDIVLCLGKSRFQVQEHCLGTRQDAHGAMLMPRETVVDEILSDTGNLCLCRHEALQDGEYGQYDENPHKQKKTRAGLAYAETALVLIG